MLNIFNLLSINNSIILQELTTNNIYLNIFNKNEIENYEYNILRNFIRRFCFNSNYITPITYNYSLKQIATMLNLIEIKDTNFINCLVSQENENLINRFITYNIRNNNTLNNSFGFEYFNISIRTIITKYYYNNLIQYTNQLLVQPNNYNIINQQNLNEIIQQQHHINNINNHINNQIINNNNENNDENNDNDDNNNQNNNDENNNDENNNDENNNDENNNDENNNDENNDENNDDTQNSNLENNINIQNVIISENNEINTNQPETILQQVSETEEEESEDILIPKCCICLTNNSSVILLPCGHICSCFKCSRTLLRCPLCRKDILSKKKIFI
jgi:hypothetical protein